MIFSLNKVIVEEYKKEALRSKEQNGFAFVEQKTKLKGLRMLTDAQLFVGGQQLTILKGTIAYIKEETLHTQQWAQKSLESDTIQGKFLIVDISFVEYFESEAN